LSQYGWVDAMQLIAPFFFQINFKPCSNFMPEGIHFW